ncbi:hypothetical protein BYT27DRAFT_7203275 [Phlegmacium glaucopus]|nr:hypothetical protein BYT27DRAFT_7203275 [Phlegmacium glaucopus]
MIVTDDWDWTSVLTDDDLSLPQSDELLSRIINPHTLQICEENGVIFFAPNVVRADLSTSSPTHAKIKFEQSGPSALDASDDS